jgi:chromosome segregation protein
MIFTRIRIVGFKSFVEPTDILIEPGLTGVVGPNGCGKSNLTEALRWVMGESSTKNMRAGAMDDVIFAGTTARPARNAAEVTLFLDNRRRTAPAAFNDAEALEVSRRIERDGGSTYRINGREVRARDVQLLFADASSGARSPALVRQGQVAELIAAKPTARRRILEEAAGISGLHARRHESELRLSAADANLARACDLMRELDAQLDALRRQARSAVRYRELSGHIQRAEALLHHRRYAEARAQLAEAEAALSAAGTAVAELTAAEAAATTAEAVAAHELPARREAEARAAAALARLTQAQRELDGEERRGRERIVELDRRLEQLGHDIERERAIAGDGESTLARLAGEADALEAERAAAGEAEADAAAAAAEAERRLDAAEEGLRLGAEALAEINARRSQHARTLKDASERLVRLERQVEEVEAELARLSEAGEDGEGAGALADSVASAREAHAAAEGAVVQVEAARRAAEAEEEERRRPLAEAERAAQRLETEAATLAKLLARGVEGRWRPVLDEIAVEPGYEVALGAALGDDLDASTADGAELRWAGARAGAEDPPLPEGAEPLAPRVASPEALARRLAQIGLVEAADGPRLAAALRPGQRLVSREGNLWRWDGFVGAAGAPSAAARRLAEKNRSTELAEAARAARAVATAERDRAEAARAALVGARAEEERARAAERAARTALAGAQEALAAAQRSEAKRAAERSALVEARARLAASLDEAEAVKRDAARGLEALAASPELEHEVAELRLRAGADRAAVAEARAAHRTLLHEAELRARRLAALQDETRRWTERRATSAAQLARLEARLAEARTERAELDGAPGALRERRLALLATLAEAESARAAAADRLAESERAHAEAGRALRAAAEAHARAREERARAEARVEAAAAKLAEVERQVVEALDVAPAAILARFGIVDDALALATPALEQELERLRRDRDRIGPVNLRAEAELAEVEARRAGLAAEKADLEGAIARLRAGIASLNRDGRARLLEAFGRVDAHFRRLFATLFGGGSAELALVEADDPLEAGLDIVARPPGKKPQSLGLLSGGEQALTATALIFAVFLTNPAPICVLDEVDAPLDDHNVERYCDLLAEMVRATSTRFLVITHNPITMARMERLFGVTMAERGVSQLVSVALQDAERLVEAA